MTSRISVALLAFLWIGQFPVWSQTTKDSILPAVDSLRLETPLLLQENQNTNIAIFNAFINDAFVILLHSSLAKKRSVKN